MQLIFKRFFLILLLIQLLHHLGNPTVHLNSLPLNGDIFYSNRVSVDDLPLRTLQLFLQSLYLLKKFLIVAIFGLDVFLGVGGDHGGSLGKFKGTKSLLIVGICRGNGSDHESLTIST